MKKFQSISLTASLLLLGSSVYAEEVTKLDSVIVTATGFETEADQEARNIIVVKPEDILNKGYQNLSQALQNTMGITFVNSSLGQNIDLRGQGKGANTAVKVLVDGVVMNPGEATHGVTPLDVIDLENVERIEVIPGGGAVIYGNGTRGGVINIITKKIAKDNVYVSLKGGTFERSKSIFGDVLFGFTKNITDQFAIQGSADVFNHKGYRVGDKEEGFYGSLKGKLAITPDQFLEVGYDHYNVKATAPGALTQAQVNENRRQSGTIGEQTEAYNNIITGKYSNKLTDTLTLNLDTYYKDSKSDFGFKEESYSGEAKLKWDYMSGSYLIGGYDFLRMNSDVGYRSLNKQSHSAFLLDKQALGDLFSIILGGRYDYSLYSGNYPGRYKIDDESRSNYAFEVTPTFSYSNTGHTYIKFERGYITPNTNQFVGRTADGVYYFNDDVKAETYNTLELGINDSLPFSDILFAVYYTESKDELKYLGTAHSPTGFGQYVNLDKTRRIGIELMLSQHLADNALTLKESISYIDAELTGGPFKDNKVPYAPTYKATLGANYSFGIMSAYVDFSFFGPSYILSNDFSYPGSTFHGIESYFLTDIGVTYQGVKNLKITAGVRNLFDEKYYDYQTTTAFYPADGRSFFVEGRYTF